MLRKRSRVAQSERLCLNIQKYIFVKVSSEIICNTFAYFNSNNSIKERRLYFWMKMTEMFTLLHSRNQKNH